MNQTTWLIVAGIYASGIFVAGLLSWCDPASKNMSSKTRVVYLAISGFGYNLLMTLVGFGMSMLDNEKCSGTLVKGMFTAQTVGCICAILAFAVVCAIVYCLKKKNPLDKGSSLDEDSCCWEVRIEEIKEDANA